MKSPETATDPVTETLHGVEITDPYRWLEGDDDRVAEWDRRQNAYTDDILDDTIRDSLGEDFEALGRRERYFLPKVRGDRYFQRIEAADQEQPALTVRESVDGEERTLIDPAEFDETTAVQWFVPDPDGERLVYGLMDAGTEQYDLRVLAVATGELIDRIDDVGRCNPTAVVWEDDGFYYMSTGTAAEGSQLEKEIRFHELGGEDRFVTDDFPQKRWPALQRDRETGLVVVAVSELAADSQLYALSDDELDPVVTDADGRLDPLVANGRVYVLTTHDAPRGRVLSIPADEFADADGFEAFETVVAEDEDGDVLAEIEVTGEGLALHRIRDAHSTVSIHDAGGPVRHELDLPECTSIPLPGLGGGEDSPDLFFHLEGFDRLESVVYVRTDSEAGPEDWKEVQHPTLPDELDPRTGLELAAHRLTVESDDGSAVPVHVVHRADVEPDSETPAVLYGYGGFRNPQLPALTPYRLPFLADGGVFAIASLRGGFEFGERWHEEGNREKKERTFEDFAAAARGLVTAGYTSHDRLGAHGRSNGGLTVGAALTRDPDLFGAIVCDVPLLDMLRFHRLLLGGAWTAEYGSPESAEAFEWLRSYSPYHNVENRPYPATLFTTAAGDTRVHPGHARKMTARVQAATTGDDPICYRSVQETGHGVGTPTSIAIDLNLDRWTFLYQHLGAVGRRSETNR